jgi:hypothetical protein
VSIPSPDRLRILAATYFKGAATQEAAAQRLRLPFSTYRRHLAAGIERVTAWLWCRELHGEPRHDRAGQIGAQT